MQLLGDGEWTIGSTQCRTAGVERHVTTPLARNSKRPEVLLAFGRLRVAPHLERPWLGTRNGKPFHQL